MATQRLEVDFVPARKKQYDVFCALVAAALGLGIGWLDLHTTEVVVTIVPLLGAGLLLGLLQPAGAWRWAALLALGLPLTAMAARLTGASTAEPAQLDPRIVLVALGVALLGCYVGAAIRTVLRAVAPGPSNK